MVSATTFVSLYTLCLVLLWQVHQVTRDCEDDGMGRQEFLILVDKDVDKFLRIEAELLADLKDGGEGGECQQERVHGAWSWRA